MRLLEPPTSISSTTVGNVMCVIGARTHMPVTQERDSGGWGVGGRDGRRGGGEAGEGRGCRILRDSLSQGPGRPKCAHN
jgi:hypothetical protein